MAAPASSAGEDRLQNSLFLRACRREATPRPPVWLMRQAGRYLKEYRDIRAEVPFIELCKNPALAAHVTADTVRRLGVDAAIIFSDLLLIVEPLGFDLSYEADHGPTIANPIRTAADLDRMRPAEAASSMAYVYEAIRQTRSILAPDIPLIGFAGAPFTMASYIIEGKGSRNFMQTKRLMYGAPDLWHALLERITTATIDYLNAQAAAGAQALQLFDSWVGCLSPDDFRTYVLPHSKRLVQGIRAGVPVIGFGTQIHGFLEAWKEMGASVIGLDWRISLDEAWKRLGEGVAVMGNLDPAVLLSSVEQVRSQTRRILAKAGGRRGHIFNLGHGVLPDTPVENVMALIETVKAAAR